MVFGIKIVWVFVFPFLGWLFLLEVERPRDFSLTEVARTLILCGHDSVFGLELSLVDQLGSSFIYTMSTSICIEVIKFTWFNRLRAQSLRLSVEFKVSFRIMSTDFLSNNNHNINVYRFNYLNVSNYVNWVMKLKIGFIQVGENLLCCLTLINLTNFFINHFDYLLLPISSLSLSLYPFFISYFLPFWNIKTQVLMPSFPRARLQPKTLVLQLLDLFPLY